MAIFLKDDFTGTAGVSIASRSPTGAGATGSWVDIASLSGIQLDGSGGINFTNVNQNFFKATDNGSADHYAQGTAGAGFDGTSFPLIVRASDSDNYVGFRITSSTYELYKRVSGSFSLITSSAGSSSAGDVFKLSVSGNGFTVTKNGTSILTATDSFNNTVTTCGILCRSSGQNDVLRDFESGSLVTITYTYARPTSDITTQWTPSTAGPHYALIDETTANDADYIYATAAGQTDEVRLASMTAPQAGTDLKVNYRVQGISGSASVTLSLVCNTTVIATDTTRTGNGDYTLNVPAATWASVADWTNMRLRFVSA